MVTENQQPINTSIPDYNLKQILQQGFSIMSNDEIAMVALRRFDVTRQKRGEGKATLSFEFHEIKPEERDKIFDLGDEIRRQLSGD
jgi:hypothetical protein